jgi:hypothetical protein
MPAGTLFSKYAPCFTEGFSIKGESITFADGLPRDFGEQDLLMPVACFGSESLDRILDDGEIDGESFAIDLNCQGRDGCFDHDQLFLVWDRADVKALMARLQEALDESGE